MMCDPVTLREQGIVAHDLKQLAVKHAELLAQDPAGDQQWLDALELRCRGYAARAWSQDSGASRDACTDGRLSLIGSLLLPAPVAFCERYPRQRSRVTGGNNPGPEETFGRTNMG
jgi:hypothetical protein